ncbi:hypothetical protein [Allocoleopsis sp.]|uniref:hypothetical protein n=1 Tax=Allocoleopsis sp. TaxID=3088169 RepID=UPI002FD23255
MTDEEKTAKLEDCLAGAGKMGALRGNSFGVASLTLDWSKTLLDPVSSGLQSWLTAVSIVLASRFPMLIYWEPELAQFYNDSFRPILGDLKHLGALRQPAYPRWTEIWELLTPEWPWQDGQGKKLENLWNNIKR